MYINLTFIALVGLGAPPSKFIREPYIKPFL